MLSVERARDWKKRAVEIVCEALSFEPNDSKGWDLVWEIAAAWPSYSETKLFGRWAILEAQVVNGKKTKIIKDGAAAVIAACRLMTCIPLLQQSIENNNQVELYRALYAIERNALVMLLTYRAAKKGSNAAKSKAAADGRAARAVSMYESGPTSKWKSAAKAAEEIGPKVGLSVEVTTKHLRRHNNETDAASQSPD